MCVSVRQALTLALPLPIAFCLHYTQLTQCAAFSFFFNSSIQCTVTTTATTTTAAAAALLVVVVVGVAHTHTHRLKNIIRSYSLSRYRLRSRASNALSLSRSRLALQVTLCHALPCLAAHSPLRTAGCDCLSACLPACPSHSYSHSPKTAFGLISRLFGFVWFFCSVSGSALLWLCSALLCALALLWLCLGSAPSLNSSCLCCFCCWLD